LPPSLLSPVCRANRACMHCTAAPCVAAASLRFSQVPHAAMVWRHGGTPFVALRRATALDFGLLLADIARVVGTDRCDRLTLAAGRTLSAAFIHLP